MDDIIKIRFIYRGEVPFKSISEAVFRIEGALKYANGRLLDRTANIYPSTTLANTERAEIKRLFNRYYSPEILIETAFLGSWGLSGKVLAGVFGVFMFFEIQGTGTYVAIKEEAHEHIHEFTLDMCDYLEDHKEGWENFSISTYKITDGFCVEFKEKLSETIFESEEIFEVSYILKLGSWENNPTDVNSLRRILAELGYELDTVGDFDVSLEMSVRDFQRSAGITPDGKVGPVTINALKSAIIESINGR